MKTQMIFTGVLGQRRAALRSSAWQMYTAIAVCVATCIVAGGNVSHGQDFPVQTASGVQGGLFKHQGSDFRVVDTAGFRTAADIGTTEPDSIAQVAYGQSCGSCGTSCGGSCGRVSDLTCGPKFTNPCQPCVPYRYGMIEALYMVPDDVSFSPTPGFGVPDFDYEFAPRITIGAVGDCVNGYEASFTGPFDWDVGNRRTAPLVLSEVRSIINQDFAIGGTPPVIAGTPPVIVTPGTPGTIVNSNVNVTDTNTISNQSQSLSAEYFSGEVSRTLNSSEFVKFLYGGRYVNYSEDYRYEGNFVQDQVRDPVVAGIPAEGITQTTNLGLRNDVENQLIGGQVGLDLLFPISRFAFTDLRLRAGAYANFAEVNYAQAGSTTLSRTPPSFVDTTTPITARSSEDEIELAGLFELGSGIRYQLGEILSVRAGIELWYLSGVATATQNLRVPGDSNNRARLSVDEDIFFTGLSVGAELRY